MRTVTAKAVGYASLCAVGLAFGVVLHQLVLVLLVAPFAALLVVGVVSAGPPPFSLHAELSADRVLEGDACELRLALTADEPLGRVELAAHLPAGLVADGCTTVSVDVDRPGRHEAVLRLAPGRWGAFELGPLAWRVRGPGDLVRHEGVVAEHHLLRVLPRREALRLLVEPARTTPYEGSHPTRTVGPGLEFADLAPHVAGEALRDLNPRVSARRGELWVNRRHPERDANVVVLVDTTSEAALQPAVRAAAALVTGYSGAHDRIGVASFGSLVRWVAPGLGDRHLYRVIDALLATRSVPTAYWRDLGAVPPGMVPANALVWLVSPLEDDRPAELAVQLRHRGHDLSVLEVDLEPAEPPGATAEAQLARRLWRLRRAARRDHLRRSGASVVTWNEDRSIRGAIAEAAAFRARRQLVGR